MWYFSWALGVSFAISFSILNALWLEHQEAERGERRVEAASSPGVSGR